MLAARTIISEVSPGLTCIGDSVSTSSNGDGNPSGTTSASASATTGNGASKNYAPVVTPAPILVAGAAAAMAYGAM
jgi:hypothetical protein